MAKLYIMMGVPGVGKSTWLSNNAHLYSNNFKVVSREDIRYRMLNRHFSKEEEIYQEFIKQINEGLARGMDVFADGTHITQMARNRLLKSIIEKYDEAIIVWVKSSLNRAIRQNNLRTGVCSIPPYTVRKLFNELEEPSINEGFTDILIIDRDLENDDETKGEEKMGRIFVTSDWHFGHDRDFIWKARGFKNVHEMNEAIIQRHNAIVTENDDVYVLGDLTLGDTEMGMKMIKQLRGKIHIILGNHDTNTKIAEYEKLYNVVEVLWATKIKVGKYPFFLTHYPCITSNFDSNRLGHDAVNLYGHTHQTDNFYNNNPLIYHVGVDSHDCTPVLIDDILTEIKEKIKLEG